MNKPWDSWINNSTQKFGGSEVSQLGGPQKGWKQQLEESNTRQGGKTTWFPRPIPMKDWERLTGEKLMG
jgi:hypothetical protein